MGASLCERTKVTRKKHGLFIEKSQRFYHWISKSAIFCKVIWKLRFPYLFLEKCISKFWAYLLQNLKMILIQTDIIYSIKLSAFFEEKNLTSYYPTECILPKYHNAQETQQVPLTYSNSVEHVCCIEKGRSEWAFSKVYGEAFTPILQGIASCCYG